MFFNTEVAADFDTCFVCGGKATTVEHVIPSWLQRRFNLWNQHLVLPNGSAIPYRQLRVPAPAVDATFKCSGNSRKE
jgi:hypothetical protein